MFRKLLKYDILSVARLWWIVALSVPGASVVGALALRFLIKTTSETVEPGTLTILLTIFAGFVSLACVTAVILSGWITTVLVYIRFYKNLFSDEGYLTFTLPVKRRDILNSKLISGLVVNALTICMLIFDAFIVLTISNDSETLALIRDAVSIFIQGTFEDVGAISIVYIIEAIILLLAMSISSFLLTAICITFAAVVAKKHKIFAAIGFYYVAGAATSVISQLAVIFEAVSLAGILSALPEKSILGVVSLIILAITALACALTAALYTLEHYLLDRKLNLS